MTSLPDYYAVLEVSPNASPEVITSAYRSLARKYHPDTNPSPEANARMKSINLAYDVLSDRNKRAEYDRKLAAAAKPAAPVTPPPSAPQPKPPPSPPPPVYKSAAAKPPVQKAAPRPAIKTPPKPGPKAPASPAPLQPASPPRTGSTFLASPAFTTFVLVFIIVFAVLTILAEALQLFDFEWLVIPVALAVAVGAAFWKRQKRPNR